MKNLIGRLKSGGVNANLRKSAFAFAFVFLVLVLLVVVLPSMDDINGMHGLVGKAIIWNRIRDFAVIPLSFSTAIMAVGLFLLSGCALPVLPKALRWTSAAVSLLMTAAAVYWTVGSILLTVYPPMPPAMGYYIWEHKEIIYIWWSLSAALLLLWRCRGEKNRG